MGQRFVCKFLHLQRLAIRVRYVKQLLLVLFCLKLLKAQMKKGVIRIAAIDLRKGSKNTL